MQVWAAPPGLAAALDAVERTLEACPSDLDRPLVTAAAPNPARIRQTNLAARLMIGRHSPRFRCDLLRCLPISQGLPFTIPSRGLESQSTRPITRPLPLACLHIGPLLLTKLWSSCASLASCSARRTMLSCLFVHNRSQAV